MAKKKTFETALKELEDIVKELESGDLLLEDAVKKYEQGVKHSRYCMDLLNRTQKRINQLSIDRVDMADKGDNDASSECSLPLSSGSNDE